MAILIDCTGKFCYLHGNFRNTEAATRGALKNFTKFTGKHLCQSLFRHETCNFMKKEAPTQVFFYEFCEIFKNNFFTSECFSKYESLYMIAAGYSCLVKNSQKNVFVRAETCNIAY